MRSNAKRAIDQVQNKEPNVSEINENIDSINVCEKMYRSTYNMMVEHIVAMCYTLKADKSFLKYRIGYQVLLYRSKYNNWEDNIIRSDQKKNWKNLIEQANTRTKVSERIEQNTTIKDKPPKPTSHIPQILNSLKNSNATSKPGVAQYTCCYCGSTSKKKPLLKFHRVPTIFGYKKVKTDAVRFSLNKKGFEGIFT